MRAINFYFFSRRHFIEADIITSRILIFSSDWHLQNAFVYTIHVFSLQIKETVLQI